MSLINLTPAQLRQAADLKERIASLNKQLTAIFGGNATPTSINVAKPVVAKKFVMSAAAKAILSAKAKARWAKIKAAKAQPAPVTKPAAKAIVATKMAPAKPKRVISAAARAKMASAAKLMWVKIKAAKAAKKK